MQRFQSPALSPAIFILFLALQGCGEDTKIVPLDFVAATAPDIVRAGDPVLVKVHWYREGYEDLRPTSISAVDDSTFELSLFVELPVNPPYIGAPPEPWQSVFTLPAAPDCPFKIALRGYNSFDLRVAIADSVPQVERFAIHVIRGSDGAGAPGVEVGAFDGDTGDTLLFGQTDADGIAENFLPCAGSERFYTASAGGLGIWAYFSGARCGVPERIVFPVD